jgi:thiol-disulfide isomerase/thioredoxin
MLKVSVGAILFFILSITASAQEINFKIKTIDNKHVELKEMYSKGAVLVNFWALWCQPCRSEMKYLDAIYQKYKDKGFTILGINQDSPKSVSKVRSYISSQKISYPVALDPNTQYLQKLNGQSVPYSLLYDSNGKLVYKHSGFLPGDEIEIEKQIEQTLSSKN